VRVLAGSGGSRTRAGHLRALRVLALQRRAPVSPEGAQG
jgi:hypothetical protein